MQLNAFHDVNCVHMESESQYATLRKLKLNHNHVMMNANEHNERN